MKLCDWFMFWFEHQKLPTVWLPMDFKTKDEHGRPPNSRSKRMKRQAKLSRIYEKARNGLLLTAICLVFFALSANAQTVTDCPRTFQTVQVECVRGVNL